MKRNHTRMRRMLAVLLCAAAVLSLFAACGEAQQEEYETNEDGMTRPIPLIDATEPLTDENGEEVTDENGQIIMVDKPKVAPQDGETTQPMASNDWDKTAAASAERPHDLYSPGDPAKNSDVIVNEFAQTGRIAWPLSQLPAAIPVAAQYIDRMDVLEGQRTLYVTEMPYDVFLAYVAKLKDAGLSIESDSIPAAEPPLKPAMLLGTLGELTVLLSWTPDKATGRIANFQLMIEGMTS